MNTKSWFGMILVAFLFVGFAVAPAHAQQPITPEQAGKYIGQMRTVCGRVASSAYAAGTKENPRF